METKTVFEQLNEAKAELKGLESGVKSEVDEAVQRATELVDEIIPALEEQVAKAKAQQEILQAIEDADVADEELYMEQEQKSGAVSFGEDIAEQVKSAGVKRGDRVEFKANTDIHVIGDATITTIDRTLGVFDDDDDLLSFFDVRTIEGNAFTYFTEGEREGDFDVVAECGLKPQIHYNTTENVAKMDKIAAYFKDSDELLEDAKWLADTIDARALYDLRDKVRNYVVNKIATTNGIGAVTASGSNVEAILSAKAKVKREGKMQATLVILNSEDWENIRKEKDGQGNYYAGSPFSANGDVETIWGLPVRVSDILPKGTALVGSAYRAGTIFEKYAGERVDVANTNEDDFIHNMITIVAEKRLGVAVRRPQAWVKVTLA